ncbi:T9SS type B sorting domain-containing protein [Flavilitoribacter nigricans]|uniref:PKD/Chitinase domain-containing protein n=1 Tax=Flavilitoribacter nigricans (strain ATCC 23147 / DSM 23189 / NBRC 102662 / NCIMB 1420 / SS-2) TaxID=1122177 RepID=A0A2D0NHN6_FLAN2|nr:gliding motility-associated C-terminal domain-containing protein [Flavilitoribacter nigricans]PHN07991.1 hypothetical protein CRP01_04345 [Flavilitoribacter nigricans DSM 23189 = NBRC 102662]
MRILNTTPTGRFLLVLSFLFSLTQMHAQVFVDQNATGANDGSSWTNAYRDLQTALTLTGNGPIWVARGTYKPISCNPCTELQRESAFRLPPDVQLYGGFAGTESSLNERDWIANPTVLSGDIGVANDSLDNVFNVLIAVNSTADNVLDGFTVEEGNADGSFGSAAGGGLLIDANPGGTGHIRIRNCLFRNNYAGGGGAIAIDCTLGGSSSAEIRNCTFEGNTASLGITSTGAAIFMQGNSGAQVRPRIVGCTFRNNFCGNDGGAISATPTGDGSLLAMQVDSCQFTNNRAADRGGAIWYRMSSFGECRVTIKNSQFLENESGGEGGAIYARSSFDNVAGDTIANCVFTQNRATGTSTINEGEGGAIFIRGSQAGTRHQQIINCVFDRNSAVLLGGAIATTSIESTPGVCFTDVVNCSFSGNTTAGRGGAIHAQDSTGTNQVRVVNSILWGDSAATDGMEIFTDRSLVAVLYSDVAGGLSPDLTDGGNNLDIDPLYADPENGDLHLPSCSPLVDRGDNTQIPPAITTDLDGDARILGAAVDLGAYELGRIYVDQSASGANNGRSWSDAFNLFEDGLAAAATGDQIWVAQGTYRPTDCATCTEADRQISFHLVPNVEAYGGFAGNETALDQRDWVTRPTVLSGDIGVPNDSLDNTFSVLIAENSTDKTILDGFIIERGNADGSFGSAAGGGLYLDANPGGTANLQIRNCTFRHNYAGGGGGIAIDCTLGGESRAEIRNCIFEFNTASLGITSTGAAIFMQGNSAAQVLPRIVNCTFRDNFCGNDGGAISATPTGEGSLLAMQIDSCLFTRNRAADRGAGIWYRMSNFGTSRVVIKNSQFLGNVAGGEGGAIYARSSFDNIANDTIANCLFSLNQATGTSTINDGEGGAVFLRASQQGTRHHTLVNCIFDRNQATLLGGALAITSIESTAGNATTDVINCTFSGNSTPGDGGAIHAEGSEGINTLNIRNSILWDNDATGNGSEIRNNNATVNLSFSDIEGGVPNGISDAGDNITTDPQFVDAANGDLHLGPCSPALDVGSNELLPPDLIDLDADGNTAEAIPLDLDGFDRIFQGTIDLGAYEFDGSEPALTVNKNITPESCGGACDGEVIVVPSGGQAGYTFDWSNGQATPKLENLCAGTYYVTINDASTCTLVDSITIEAGEALGLMVSPDLESCPGETSEFFATASGGVGILTYNWDNGLGSGNLQSVNPEVSTTYSVTVSDFNGCTETDSVTVAVFDRPEPAIQGAGSICPGGTTTLDAGDFATYQWSTGAQTQQIEVAAAGVYSLTVTDENACTASTDITITQADSLQVNIIGELAYCPGTETILDAGPFATYQWSTGAATREIAVSSPGNYRVLVTDESGCPGTANVTVAELASVTVGIAGDTAFCSGTGTLLDAGVFTTYQWSTGADVAQIEVNESGIYGVTVTNAEGCQGTAEITVTELMLPAPAIAGNDSICPGSSTLLNAGDFTTYLWSNGAATREIEVSETGIYSVAVTDENGCPGTAEIEITAADSLLPVIQGTDRFCAGDTVTLAGSTGFDTYQWSNGLSSPNIAINTAGTYGLTVTDAMGCSGSASFTLTQDPDPIPAISGATSLCPGATATLDAGSFSGYLWSTGDTTRALTVSTPGTYSLTVTDDNGCSGSTEVNLPAADSLEVSIQGSATFCAGSSAVLTGEPGFATYAWSTGAIESSIEVDTEGTYSLTVTDMAGCSGTAAFSINESASLSPVINGELDLCPGSVTTLDGGVFSAYAWSTGANGAQIEVSEPGLYGLIVTDEAGCTGTAEVEVVSADSLETMILGTSSFCPGSSTTLTGETGFAAYAWSTGATETGITVSEPGTYRLTVTDERGCTGSAQIETVLADSLTLEILGSETFCPGSNTVLSGPAGFTSYLWSTGATVSSITVNQPGTYRLTVTDATGCSGSAALTVSEGASLSPTISGSLTFCAGASTILSVGSFASYQWSTGATTREISISTSGIYSVTVSDGEGCNGSAQVTAKVQSSSPPQITGITTFCPGDSTVLDGGEGYSAYQWSDGSTTRTITVRNEGTYALTVSDEVGCTATDEVLISFDLPADAMAGAGPESCADTLLLAANQPPGTIGRWTTDAAGVSILEPDAANSRITDLPESPVNFTWTLSTADCPDYSSDAVTVNPGQGPVARDDQAMIAATASRTLMVNLLTNDELPAGGTPLVTITNEPSLGTVLGIENGVLSYLAPEGAFGAVSLTYELCLEACPCSTATLTITIEAGAIEEMEIANAITPNGDGLNEFFVFDIIRNTPPEASPDNELTIFNRWGDVVFYQENYDNSWTGLNNQGNPLPEATYYYILRLNIGEGVIIRGDITVIR